MGVDTVNVFQSETGRLYLVFGDKGEECYMKEESNETVVRLERISGPAKLPREMEKEEAISYLRKKYNELFEEEKEEVKIGK